MNLKHQIKCLKNNLHRDSNVTIAHVSIYNINNINAKQYQYQGKRSLSFLKTLENLWFFRENKK